MWGFSNDETPCNHSDNDGLKPTRSVSKKSKAALLLAKHAQRAGRGIDLTVLDLGERDLAPIV